MAYFMESLIYLFECLLLQQIQKNGFSGLVAKIVFMSTFLGSCSNVICSEGIKIFRRFFMKFQSRWRLNYRVRHV
jgi:hypothetical protein